MPGLLNNPWVVGIGGGVLSGAVVAWVTHVVLARGENKEYRERIASANRDVVYAIRPGISEGHIPTRPVIEALIHATARRHNVLAENMYGPQEIAEELIKEVMDTSFLSSAKKADYCLQLMPLQKPTEWESEVQTIVKNSESAQVIADYRRKSNLRLSATLGLMSALMSALVPVFALMEREKDIFRNFESRQFVFIIFTTSIVLGSTALVYQLSRLRARESHRSSVRDEQKDKADAGASNVDKDAD
jgi:hypothetical protein